MIEVGQPQFGADPVERDHRVEALEHLMVQAWRIRRRQMIFDASVSIRRITNTTGFTLYYSTLRKRANRVVEDHRTSIATRGSAACAEPSLSFWQSGVMSDRRMLPLKLRTEMSAVLGKQGDPSNWDDDPVMPLHGPDPGVPPERSKKSHHQVTGRRSRPGIPPSFFVRSLSVFTLTCDSARGRGERSVM